MRAARPFPTAPAAAARRILASPGIGAPPFPSPKTPVTMASFSATRVQSALAQERKALAGARPAVPAAPLRAAGLAAPASSAEHSAH